MNVQCWGKGLIRRSCLNSSHTIRMLIQGELTRKYQKIQGKGATEKNVVEMYYYENKGSKLLGKYNGEHPKMMWQNWIWRFHVHTHFNHEPSLLNHYTNGSRSQTLGSRIFSAIYNFPTKARLASRIISKNVIFFLLRKLIFTIYFYNKVLQISYKHGKQVLLFIFILTH